MSSDAKERDDGRVPTDKWAFFPCLLLHGMCSHCELALIISTIQQLRVQEREAYNKKHEWDLSRL